MTDPLNFNIPLADVDSSIPILPEGDYGFQIVESSIVENAKKTGRNWKLRLALQDPTTSTTGREISPNFPVYHVTALQPSENSTDPQAYLRQIVDVVDAVLGTKEGNRPNFNQALVDSCVGKLIRARIFIDTYQDKESNKVKRFLKQNS